MNGKRLSFEEIELRVNNLGFGLKSKPEEFLNNNQQTKILIVCSEGHEKYIKIKHLSCERLACSECSGHKKHTIEEVRLKVAERIGFELISTEYINVESPLIIRCPEGHEFSISYNKFINTNRGCHVCNGAKPRHTEEDIIEKLTIKKFKLLSKFTTIKKRITVECEAGHVFDVVCNQIINNNTGCRQCYEDNCKGENTNGWKGGKASLRHSLRNAVLGTDTNKRGEWGEEVRKRDKRTCQVTGRKGGNLHVHHLYSFSALTYDVLKELGFENRVNKSRCDFTEEEFSSIISLFREKHKLEECITIWSKAHDLFHSSTKKGFYGKTNNTPEQMEEFKQRYQAGEFTI